MLRVASPTAVDASAATSLPVVNSGSSDIYDDPGTSQPMSERSKQWLAYDKEHGTLWGRDWLYYRLLQQRLPPSISLLQAAAGVRRVSREMLQQRKTLNSIRLREDLSCPICMSILDQTVVVKSCLHRFCAECIEKCVRIGIRECPQCRSHVASRRSLRPDGDLDRIGALVSPLQLQQHPKKHGSILNTSSSSKAYALLLLRPPTPPPFVDASGQLVPRQQQQQSHGRPPSLCAADAAGFAVAGSTHSRYLTMAMQAALPPPERKRLRRELSLLLRRHQASTAAAAEGGDSAAAVHLRLYTKEHRAPFGPNLTLAALHQLSLAYPTESLVVYYTTRSYNDEALSSLGGNASSRSGSSQAKAAASLPAENLAATATTAATRAAAASPRPLSTISLLPVGTPDGLLAGALGARCALPPESGPTPERQREHAANASSTRASTAMQQHLPAAVLGAARTPQGSAVAVPHPAAAASAGRFGSGAAFKPLDASLPVAAADQVPRRSAAVGMPYRPSGVGAPGTAASSFAGNPQHPRGPLADHR
ncbi:zinc finger (c3hc4 ring finger) domain-containing protein [Cyclospora cayetanensis]|uniref:RING-type E3 ubiquitin transferase n=1 Tax=Cyclospora cayetanensis TaxID=88456 RepID=A0A1D3CWB5_9EIME|nr:zinc finger (c3hc4 ring finger) domain-containing protein [Cyclospora cayetanensis]